METQDNNQAILDNFLRSTGGKKVNFIKLDVDGNEADVRMGAKEIIKTYKLHLTTVD